jgi:hypothetical protein
MLSHPDEPAYQPAAAGTTRSSSLSKTAIQVAPRGDSSHL